MLRWHPKLSYHLLMAWLTSAQYKVGPIVLKKVWALEMFQKDSMKDLGLEHNLCPVQLSTDKSRKPKQMAQSMLRAGIYRELEHRCCSEFGSLSAQQLSALRSVSAGG